MLNKHALLKALSAMASGLALLVSAVPCGAQTASSSKPITFVVPYGAGGSTDIMARVMAQYLPQVAGAGVGNGAIVENRTGGGGLVGWGSVARAVPDGTTVLTNEISFPISAALLPSMPFDPKTAFAHITIAASVPHVLVVHPSVPAKTLKEFVAYAKANPGKLNYGSGGNGTNTHMGAEFFKSLTHVFSTHIPYRGGGPALVGVLAGDVQWMVTALPGALPHIKSGKVRALMVTANERSAVAPEIPSAKESGLDMDMPFWLGFSVPSSTPTAVQAKLQKDMTTVLAMPEVKKRLGEMGFSVIASSSIDAKKLVESDMVRWSKLIKTAGIKAD
jgi:tripartite-type tricarboxylate transporter receptor subunit TctC